MMFKDNPRVRLQRLEAAFFSVESTTGSNIVTLSSVTQGVLDATALGKVKASNANYITLDGNRYRVYRDATESGYKIYAYHDGEHMHFITVMLNSGSWMKTNEV